MFNIVAFFVSLRVVNPYAATLFVTPRRQILFLHILLGNNEFMSETAIILAETYRVSSRRSNLQYGLISYYNSW